MEIEYCVTYPRSTPDMSGEIFFTRVCFTNSKYVAFANLKRMQKCLHPEAWLEVRQISPWEKVLTDDKQ